MRRQFHLHRADQPSDGPLQAGVDGVKDQHQSDEHERDEERSGHPPEPAHESASLVPRGDLLVDEEADESVPEHGDRNRTAELAPRSQATAGQPVREHLAWGGFERGDGGRIIGFGRFVRFRLPANRNALATRGRGHTLGRRGIAGRFPGLADDSGEEDGAEREEVQNRRGEEDDGADPHRRVVLERDKRQCQADQTGDHEADDKPPAGSVWVRCAGRKPVVFVGHSGVLRGERGSALNPPHRDAASGRPFSPLAA